MVSRGKTTFNNVLPCPYPLIVVRHTTSGRWRRLSREGRLQRHATTAPGRYCIAVTTTNRCPSRFAPHGTVLPVDISATLTNVCNATLYFLLDEIWITVIYFALLRNNFRFHANVFKTADTLARPFTAVTITTHIT
jgi:hypothetical protein